MVEPVDAVVERSEPGEVEVEGKVVVRFSISDVRVAKVSHGFVVAAGVNVVARFLKHPERVVGLCGPGVQHRAASFVVRRIASVYGDDVIFVTEDHPWKYSGKRRCWAHVGFRDLKLRAGKEGLAQDVAVYHVYA
jgi:hypothetical protein